MSNNTGNVSHSSGVGIFGLLGVLFVALKLTGNIAWPWLWVLAPFWGPLAAVGLFVILAFVIAIIAKLAGA